MRYFNTAGPCVPELHYMVPPEPLLPEARELIREGQHLVVYAPRPTGKTTTLAALAQNLTAEGGRVALLVSCERAKVAGDDYAAAELQILAAIAEEARRQNLPGEYQPPSPWPAASPGSRLHSSLSEWAERCRCQSRCSSTRSTRCGASR